MDVMEKIIGIAIGAILVASIAPTAISQLVNASTSGWGTAELAVWGVVPVFVVLAFLFVILSFIRRD